MNIFVCPLCKKSLVFNHTSYNCNYCSKVWPLIQGIPDFRVNVDFKIREEEISDILKLLSSAPSLSFEEILRIYLESTTDPELLKIEIDYEINRIDRAEKEIHKINYLFNRSGRDDNLSSRINNNVYLDIGCGKGVLLAVLAPLCRIAVGLDYSLVYIFLAKILLEELGINNVALAAAEAEYLPLKNNSVEFITALDVVEHLSDPNKGLQEASRVLTCAGNIFINSPNRYSLLAPEDHVRLWFVGFVPRKYVQKFIKVISGRSYVGVYLLSYKEIKYLVMCNFSSYIEEGVIYDSNKLILTRKEIILKRYPFILWVLNNILTPILPSHHFLATK